MNLTILFTLLTTLHCCHGDQLSKLINFLNGGANPAGAATATSAANRGGGGQRPQNRQPAPVALAAAPVPFSAPADPTIRTVALDVPQPKPTLPQTANPAAGLIAASSPPRFAGLPSGATQVAGTPVTLPARHKKKPAPLSEIEAPIFLSETFRSPLNDVDPHRAPVGEPSEALAHRFLPGLVPQVIPVANKELHSMFLLHQNAAELLQQNQLDYNKFTQNVFNSVPEPHVQLGGEYLPVQQDLGLAQVDQVHATALQKHREEIDAVRRQQQQQQQQQQPGQLHTHAHINPVRQPPAFNGAAKPSPSSHFSIPGVDQQTRYEEELRVAQEVLKNLG